MNRTLILTLAATAGAAAIATAVLSQNTIEVTDGPGRIDISIPAPHHDGQDLKGLIWYPSQSDGRGEMFAENPVFFGVDSSYEATIQDGTFPVVLLSHGMGGHSLSMSWLGSELAKQGAIVVSVNHINSTFGNFDIQAGMNHWTRAQDLTLALDTLMADPAFAGHIDTSRIMAAGFSYGGWTALSLGGLLGDHAGYVQHCATYGVSSSHCNDLMNAHVSLEDVDPALWNASYADPRVTSVFAVDPGLIWGLDGDNVAPLVPDVHLIALGDGDDRLLATNFDLSGFADLLPDAQITHFAPASHFMFLPLCKPAGEAILIEEKDDPVCTDPAGADRDKLHDDVIALMAADLGL